MSAPRAAKKGAEKAPAKNPSAPREYEVSLLTSTPGTVSPVNPPTYQRQGAVLATSAAGAIRTWCERQGETFAGGTVRAVPTGYITEATVTVETKRQLTLGTP